MEFTLLWAALTGVGLAWLGTRLWPEHLPERPLDRLVAAAATGLIAGRLAAMVLQGINPLTHPGDILIVRGGVDTGVATIAAVSAYLWSVRGETRLLDAVAPAAVLGLAGWHAGCMWRSACLGTASDLPWAWAEAGSTVTRHPVELYTALGLALAAFAISRLPWHPLLRSGLALGAASGLRLLTEPLRLSLTGGPIEWYLTGLAIGIGAAALGPRLLHRRSRTT